jgi:hypothetical protein
MTTAIDELLVSWVPIKQVPFYAASQNKITEIDKRRILIGFRSEGEPQTVEGDSKDLIDLRLTLADFEEEKRQKAFIALSSGNIVATSGPKRDLRFRWIKKSFWSLDPGSKIATGLTENPSVNVLRRQSRWRAAIVLDTTPDNLDHVYELQVLLVKSTNEMEEPLYWKSVCTYSLVNRFQINENRSSKDYKRSFEGGNYLIECSLTTKSKCSIRLKESISNKTLFYRKNGALTLLDSVWKVLSDRPDSKKGFAMSYVAVIEDLLPNEGWKLPKGLQAFANDTTVNRSSFELFELFELYLNEDRKDVATDLFEKEGLVTSLLDGYVPFPATNENFLIKIEKTIANWQSSTVSVKEISFVDALYAVYLKSGYGANRSPSEALEDLIVMIYALPRLLERFFPLYAEEIFDEINLLHGKIDAISNDETDFSSFFKRDVLSVNATHDYYHDFGEVSTDAALVTVTKITKNDALVVKYPPYTNVPLLKPKVLLVSQKTSFSPFDLIENERIFDYIDGIVLGDFLQDKETWKWCKPMRRSKRGTGYSELNLVEEFSSTYFLEIDPTDDENESYYELWLVSDLLLKTTAPSCDVITKQLVVSVTVRTPLSVEKRIKANSKNGENVFSYKMRLPSDQRLIAVLKSNEYDFRSSKRNGAIFPVSRNDEYRSEKFPKGSDENLVELTRVFDESDDSSFYNAVIAPDLQEIFLNHWKDAMFPSNRFPNGPPSEDQKVSLLRSLFGKRYGKKKNELERLIKRMSTKNPKVFLTLGGLEETVEDYLTNDRLRLSFSLAKGTLPQTRDERFLSDETVFFVYRSVLMDKVYSMFRNFVRYEEFGPFEDLYYGGFVDYRSTSETIRFVEADLDNDVERNQYEISAKAKKAFLFACVREFGPSLRTSWYENVEEKWNEPTNANEKSKTSLLSYFCSLHAKTLEDILVKLFRNNVSRWWRSILDGSIFSFKFSKSVLPPSSDLPPSNDVKPTRSADYDALIENQMRELEILNRKQSKEAQRTFDIVLKELEEELSTIELSDENVSKLLIEKKETIYLSRILQRAKMEELLKRQSKERYDFISNDLKESYDEDRRVAAVENDPEEVRAVIELYETKLELFKNERERKTIELENRLEDDHREEDEADAVLVSYLKALDMHEAKNKTRRNVENLELKWTRIVGSEREIVSSDEELDLLTDKILIAKELDKALKDTVFISDYEEALETRKRTDREKELEEEEKKRDSERERERSLRSLEEKKREEDENRRVNEELRRRLELATEEANKTQKRLREAEEELRLRRPERLSEEGGGGGSVVVSVPGASREESESNKKEIERLKTTVAELETQTKEIEEKRRSEELELARTKAIFEETTKRKEKEEIEKREREERESIAKRDEELRKAERKRLKEEEARKTKEESDRKNEEMMKQMEILKEENEKARRERLEAQKRTEEELEKITKEKKELEERLLEKDKAEREGEDDADKEMYALPPPPPLAQSTTSFATRTVSTTSASETPTKTFVPDKNAKSSKFLRTPETSPRERSLEESPVKRLEIEFNDRLKSEESTRNYLPDPRWFQSLSKLVRIKISKAAGERNPDYVYSASILKSFVESKTKGEAVIHAFRIYNVFLTRIIGDKIKRLIETTDPVNVNAFRESMGSLTSDFYDLTGDITGTMFLLSIVSETINKHERRQKGIILNKTSFGRSIFNYFCLKMVLCRGFCSDYQEGAYWIPDRLFEAVTSADTPEQYRNDFFLDFSLERISEYENEKTKRFSLDPPEKKEPESERYVKDLNRYELEISKLGSGLFYRDEEGGTMIDYLKNRFKRFVSLRRELRELISKGSQTISSRWVLSYVTFFENFALNWMLENYLSVAVDRCCAEEFATGEIENYASSESNPVKIFENEKTLDKKAKPWSEKKGKFFVVPSYVENAFSTRVENYNLAFTQVSPSVPDFSSPSYLTIVSFSNLLTPESKSAFRKILSLAGSNAQISLTSQKSDFSASMTYLFSKRRMRDFIFLSTREFIKPEDDVSSQSTKQASSSGPILSSIPLFLIDRTDYLSSANSKNVTTVNVKVKNQTFSVSSSSGLIREAKTLSVHMKYEFKATAAIWTNLISNVRREETSDSILSIGESFASIGPKMEDFFFDARGHDEPNRIANFPPVVSKSYSSFDDCLTIFKILYELNPEWIFREDVLPSVKTRSWKIEVLKTDGSTGELYEESENEWGKTKWSFYKKEIASEPIKREIYNNTEDNYEKKRENDIADSLIVRKSIAAAEKADNKMPFLAILLRMRKRSDSLSSSQREILNGLIFEVKRFVDADQSLFGMGLYRSDLEPYAGYVSELLDVYERFESRRISFEFTTKEDERVRTLPEMDAVEFLKRTCGKSYRSFYGNLHEKSRSAFEQTFEEFMAAYPQIRLLMYCYFYYKVNDGARPKIVYSIYREREFLSYVSKNGRASAMEKFDVEDALNSVPMYTKDGIDYNIRMIVDSEDKGWFLREMGAKFWEDAFGKSTIIDNTTIDFVVEDKGSFLYGSSLWGKYALGMTRSEIAGLPATRKFFGGVDVVGSTSVFEMNSLIADRSKPAIDDVVAAAAIPKFTKRRTPRDDSNIAPDEYEPLSEFVCIGKRETRPNYRNALRKFDALANLDRILTDFFLLARGDETEERKIVRRYKAEDVYDNGTLVIKM